VSSASELLSIVDTFLESAAGVRTVRRKRRLLRPIIGPFEKAIAAAFKAQGAAFGRRLRAWLKARHAQESLREAVEPLDPWDEWEPLFTLAELESLRAFVDAIDLWTGKALESGAKAQLAELKVETSFTLQNPRAVAWLQGRAAARVTMINQATRTEIARIVTQAVAEGWSYDRTAEAITARFAEFAVGRPQQHIDSRAHLVAVQEASEAYEHGNMVVADDLAAAGLQMEKSYLTVNDSRVSPECRENQAAGWIPLNDPFPGGVQRAPQHVACRCCTLYRRARQPT